MEEVVRDEPTIMHLPRSLIERAGTALGREPSLVRIPYHLRFVACTPIQPSTLRTEKSLCREKGHLRVVGDGSRPPVGGDKAGEPSRPETAPNRGQALELDGRSECVPYCPSEDAPEETAPGIRWCRSTAVVIRH